MLVLEDFFLYFLTFIFLRKNSAMKFMAVSNISFDGERVRVPSKTFGSDGRKSSTPHLRLYITWVLITDTLEIHIVVAEDIKQEMSMHC